MSKSIKYTSENGFTGIMYGESSLSIGIEQEDGTFKEYLHTGSRAGNSAEWLKDQVDNFPNFLKMLDEVK